MRSFHIARNGSLDSVDGWRLSRRLPLFWRWHASNPLAQA